MVLSHRSSALWLTILLVLIAFTSHTRGQEEEEDTCETETLALNTQSEISTATTTLLTTTKDAILADFTDFCRLISLTCTADLAEYSQDLKDACTSSGGVLHEENYKINCQTDTVSPIEIPGTVRLVNLPSCLSTACDPDNLPPSIQQVQDQVFNTINTEVDEALGDNVKCDVGSSASSRFKRSWTEIVALTTLMIATIYY